MPVQLLLLALEETARDLLELVPAAEAAEAADAASGHDDSSDDDEDLSEEQRRTLNRRLVAIGRVRDVRTLRHRALFLLGFVFFSRSLDANSALLCLSNLRTVSSDWFHVAQDVEAETSYYDQAAALRQVLHARPSASPCRYAPVLALTCPLLLTQARGASPIAASQSSSASWSRQV